MTDMNEAVENIIDYLFYEESKNFYQNLDDDDKKNPVAFMAKLKEHIFYSVVVLSCKGDKDKFDEWFEETWLEHGEPDE